MRVKVEQCWAGGDRYNFRFTLPDGKRESLPGYKWGRDVASRALDLLEHVYGLTRRNIRFDVR